MASVQAAGTVFQVDKTPHECPRCHKQIAALPHGGVGGRASSPGEDEIQVPFTCPACGQLFIAVYKAKGNGSSLWLARTEPTVPLTHAFGLVDTLSPIFVTVYNEAVAAEAFGLNEIAGLAYRKSLEFLIKDYCIHLYPNATDTIKKSFLSAVIKTYFKDTMIGNAAEKATWLGNDEAHYVRKWEQHDISSLKALLRMVINGVNEKLEYDSIMASFEPAEPKNETPS